VVGGGKLLAVAFTVKILHVGGLYGGEFANAKHKACEKCKAFEFREFPGLLEYPPHGSG
jgi:hypothetical protein